MGLGGGLLAGGGDHLLAVLRDGRVHDLVILLLFKVVCRYLDISTVSTHLVALLPGGLHLAGGAGLHGHGVAHGGGHRHGRRRVPVVPSLGLGLGGGLGLGLGLAPDEGGLGGGDTEQQGEDLHSGSVGWRSLPACST